MNYPKIISVNIPNIYSCNICSKEFESEDLDLSFLAICSAKCRFKAIYYLIKNMGYSKENYREMLKIINKEIPNNEFKENLAIYELTKYYFNKGLSNIKHLGSRLKAMAQGSTNSPKAQGSTKTPPIYRGVEPEPEPNYCLSSNGNLSLTIFGGNK